MNVNLTDQIYRDIKKYVQENSSFSPRVVQKSLKQSDKFPLITVVRDDNKNALLDTQYRESIDQLLFNIDIYAQDKAVGNETISNVNIVNELISLVDYVMRRIYKMKRESCKPTPNLDDSIYRVTMKYTKKIIPNKNILI